MEIQSGTQLCRTVLLHPRKQIMSPLRNFYTVSQQQRKWNVLRRWSSLIRLKPQQIEVRTDQQTKLWKIVRGMCINNSETWLCLWTMTCWANKQMFEQAVRLANPMGAAGRGSGPCKFKRVKYGKVRGRGRVKKKMVSWYRCEIRLPLQVSTNSTRYCWLIFWFCIVCVCFFFSVVTVLVRQGNSRNAHDTLQ